MGKTQEIGQAAENAALQYLQQQGLRWVTSNFRCRLGEIDLIMYDRDSLVFVEVRYRQSSQFGDSLESVTTVKQDKLTRTASFYLQQQNLSDNRVCRFDVVGITAKAGKISIEWIKNAF